MNHSTPKVKKPIYKRIWFWILIVVVVIGINGAMNGNSDDKNSSSTSTSSEKKTTESKTKTSTPKKEETKVLTGEEKALDGLKGNALAQTKTAISYLNTAHLSKQGLYDQLTSEYGSQMTPEEANAAIARLDPLVNWNNLAVVSAQSYRDTGNLTGQALLDQLTSEYGSKFPADQAQYGVDHVDDEVKSSDFWNK
ncbi:Ltp family lipoprotein [Lactococcus garvieae]|uniref:Ltp family lipoprotein n=1 Tax=Lactococcus garvieae TaxID=1363 RepID=UPI0030D3A7BE